MKNILIKNKTNTVKFLTSIFIVFIFLNIFSIPQISDASILTNSTISIPSIGLKSGPIVESKTIKGIDNRIWRRPNSRTPDQGSNTVFVAHRIITLNGWRKGIFYRLPEVKVGDKVAVNWNGKVYNYTVYDRQIVGPKHVEIEFGTADSIITLYTCVYTAHGKDRVVVKARLDAPTP